MAVFYRLYSYRSQKWHHKIVKTRRAKYFSSFLGGVEEYPTLGFTILFCCGIFGFDEVIMSPIHVRKFVTQPRHITGCDVGFKSWIPGLLI